MTTPEAEAGTDGSPPQPPPDAPYLQWDPPSPADWQQYPPPGQATQEHEGFAVAAFLLGLIPVLAGVLGILFGCLALSRIRATGRKGKGLAVAGVVLGSLWLVGIGIAVAVGVLQSVERDESGQVVTSGDVSVSKVRLGDCLSAVPLGSNLSTVRVVPCGELHAAEVYALFELPEGPFPGDAQVIRFAEGGCTARKDAALSAAVTDDHDVYFIHPERSGWDLGDRSVTCLIVAPDGKSTAGSLRSTTG